MGERCKFWGTLLFTAAALSAETKVKLEDLPAAVQKSVKEQTKNATLVGLSKESEKGRTMYEAETKVNGKSRDLLLDASGRVVDIEEETELASLPAAAKAAIEKQAGSGKISKVETVTHGTTVSYEAVITSKAGKNKEVGVNADGSPHK